jgi:hypothetical protein
VDVDGIVSSKDDSDWSDILFHHNDLEMYQTHQGVKSTRKPDVVVVSEAAARKAQKDGNLSHKADVLYDARKKPEENFQWGDVHSILEFKRTGRMKHPTAHYDLSTQPEPKYMDVRKEVNVAQPTVPVLVPAATASQGPSTQRTHFVCSPTTCTLTYPAERRSERIGKKRTSDNVDSNERSNKRAKSNNENRNVEDEAEKPHPAVQNGLYVAEMFAAHIARQHVISCVVMSKYLA